VLYARRPDGNLTVAEGALSAIAAEAITFRWKGADRRVGRSDVVAIELAATAETTDRPAGALVGRDGSSIPFSALSMDEQAVRVDAIGLGSKQIPRGAVASVRFASDRVVPLASLTPTTVRQYGLFDTSFPHRRNASTAGGPLRLGGETYAAGLGLHSFCELTYALQGQYSVFVAVAGIDDAARPLGDARLSLLGDDRPLLEPIRLTGKDEPVTVRVDLGGVRKLTIRVDFGPDKLDVADHVDLADARLIR
jgi:hypothetical protein